MAPSSSYPPTTLHTMIRDRVRMIKEHRIRRLGIKITRAGPQVQVEVGTLVLDI
jgi:hypothetical protein